jgi:predicted RecA/RadA family phage recombinase
MKNFYGKGNAVYVPAPAGGVVSGQPVLIGSLFGFAGMDAPAGATFALHVVGEYWCTKVDNQAWTVGAPIYWDSTALNFTNVVGTNTKVGVATQAVPTGTGHTQGLIRLNGSY